MNYYEKYIKYKFKYLNLLGKGKTDINPILNINPENISESNERDVRLSTLLNIYITESIYEPNIFANNIHLNSIITNSNEVDEKLKQNKKGTKRKIPEIQTQLDENFVQTKYNLRNVKYNLRKETETEYFGTYTPEIKKKLESNGMDTKAINKLIKLFNQDDKNIVEKTKKQNDAYIDISNNGKVIECWIGDNMYCPCCKSKSLRRYVKDNMPCIDLLCVNSEHKFIDGVKFFQVKAKLKGIKYIQYQNFNYDLKLIHTGSREIGQYANSITIDDEYNMLAFGYICVEYDKIIKLNEEYIKILSSSFIVLPKINKITAKLFENNTELNNMLIAENYGYHDYGTLEKNNLYYWYTDSKQTNKQIEFNVNNNQIIRFGATNKQILFGNILMQFSSSYNLDSSKWKITQNPFVI